MSAEHPYGLCPECGSPGVFKARDFVGTTRCANGHQWVPAPRRSTTVDLTLTHEEFILVNSLAIVGMSMLQGKPPEGCAEHIDRARHYSPLAWIGMSKKMADAANRVVAEAERNG